MATPPPLHNAALPGPPPPPPCPRESSAQTTHSRTTAQPRGCLRLALITQCLHELGTKAVTRDGNPSFVLCVAATQGRGTLKGPLLHTHLVHNSLLSRLRLRHHLFLKCFHFLRLRSPVAQAGLKLSLQLGKIPSSFLYFLSAGSTGVQHHICFMCCWGTDSGLRAC